MQNTIVLKRLKAFVIDYLIILIYIGMLFGGTILISRLVDLKWEKVNPVKGEIIGFATLTLPVILYFTLSEKGKYRGTIGKRKNGLQVVSKFLTKASSKQLLLRNCLKFLPWELAHFFIYRLFYFNSLGKTIPDWVLTGLLVSQGLALIYLFCILFTKKKQSIYELLSGTIVVNTTDKDCL